MDDPNTPERHINIHFSPDIMAGVYSNFANVSHSDYEFTITFARVDHEVEDEEIPGVVVSRVNLSPKFMRELIDAMQDNYSKWEYRENVKSLPEVEGGLGIIGFCLGGTIAYFLAGQTEVAAVVSFYEHLGFEVSPRTVMAKWLRRSA